MQSGLNNKNGQLLGRKGLETRQRLMEAAQRLLVTQSPFELTAVGIAKEAETASPTFYVYFDDVQDVLHALSAMASLEFNAMAEQPFFDDPAALADDSRCFIEAFNRVWDRHSAILLYRNLEADRGEMRFYELRADSALPLIARLAAAMGRAQPGWEDDGRNIHAEAVVLFAAIERLAATTHQNIDPRVPKEALRSAQVRVMIRLLHP